MTPSWRNAKKKESDDLPVIRAVAEAKKSSRNVPLSRFVVASQFSLATFFRYGCRAELGLPLWGPRGKPKAVTIEDDIVQDVLKSQWHGGRHRLRGVADIRLQHPEFTEQQIQNFANEVRNELLQGNAKSMISVEYGEPHLMWSLDIFEKWHRGIKFRVLQVMDLGSRIKLFPAIKPGDFTGEEIAEHINMLMRIHGAPLFLKRDNGGNLNSRELFEIMKMFAVIPFNSPPYCPQFNGVMERSQGEIKRYLRFMLKDTKTEDTFSAAVYLAIDRANHRKRKVLNGQNALECWEKPFLKFSKREREAIYFEIKDVANQILHAFSPQKQKRKDAFACAWRKAVTQYLEAKEYIRLYRDGKPLREAMA